MGIEKNKWTIGIGNSDVNEVRIYHVCGTNVQVKKKLLALVAEDQAADEKSWDNGTKEVNEITVTYIDDKEVSYNAFNSFINYHIDYTAKLDTELEELDEVEEDLICDTVTNIAKRIAKEIHSHPGGSMENIPFNGVDFCTDDGYYDPSKLRHENTLRTCGWFGIKKLQTGFNNNDFELAIDYYGGGALSTVTIYAGEEEECVVKDLTKAILSSIEVNEGTLSEDTKIIAEFLASDCASTSHKSIMTY